MKKNLSKYFMPFVFALAALSFAACKSKPKDAAATMAPAAMDTTTTMAAPPASAPVVISPDDSLTALAKDAVKDFPGVNVAVNDGVATLTGNISRDKLMQMMMSLHAMHPKKIINNLTIK